VGDRVVAGCRPLDRAGVLRIRFEGGGEGVKWSDELRLLPRCLVGEEVRDKLRPLCRCVAADSGPWFLPSCLAGEDGGGVSGRLSSSSSFKSSLRVPWVDKNVS